MELHVKDLVCHRGGVPVLAGVTFSLTDGQAEQVLDLRLCRRPHEKNLAHSQ